MSTYHITVNTFAMGTNKECARKIPEEAAEVFAEYIITSEMDGNLGTERLADELADVVQAACNLAARYDIDLSAAMERCERRNRERGRYRSPQPEMTEGARAILDRMMEGANDE